MRRRNEIPALGMNFVVQRDNFREIIEFIALADSLGADHIWFQRIVNYGSYDEATFAAINVCDPAHPDHAELLEVLRDPRIRRETINIHMLLALLPEVVASDERLEFLY
jgi:MoaA/NifB/PqqE/SkfB family radical SAM enzyme